MFRLTKKSIYLFYTATVILGFVAFQNCSGIQGSEGQKNSTSNVFDPVACANSTLFVDCSAGNNFPQFYMPDGCPQFACQTPANNPVNLGPDTPENTLCNPSAPIPSCPAGQRLTNVVVGNCTQIRCSQSTPQDDLAFVTSLYTTWFGRAPDQAGLNYWTGVLQGGMSREQLQVAFLMNPIQSDQDFILNNRAQMLTELFNNANEPLPQWYRDATNNTGPITNPGEDPGNNNPGTLCSARTFQNGSFTSQPANFNNGETALVPVALAHIEFVQTTNGSMHFQARSACLSQRRTCNNGTWVSIQGEAAVRNGTAVNSRITSVQNQNFEADLISDTRSLCGSAVEVREARNCNANNNYSCLGDFSNSDPVSTNVEERRTLVRNAFQRWFNRAPEAIGLNYWTLVAKHMEPRLLSCAIARGAQNVAPHFDRDAVIAQRDSFLELVNTTVGCYRPDWIY